MKKIILFTLIIFTLNSCEKFTDQHRYFIVSYDFENDECEDGLGCVFFETDNNSYPNYMELKKFIGFKTLVVLNIQELTKNDYEQYCKDFKQIEQ